eukprot:7362161-Karenia_brevis.AAC.1
MSALPSSPTTSVGDWREDGVRAADDHSEDPAVAIKAQLGQLQSMLNSARKISPRPDSLVENLEATIREAQMKLASLKPLPQQLTSIEAGMQRREERLAKLMEQAKSVHEQMEVEKNKLAVLKLEHSKVTTQLAAQFGAVRSPPPPE